MNSTSLDNNPPTVQVARPYKGWQPASPLIIRDPQLRQVVHEQGFAVLDWLDSKVIDSLRSLYSRLHSINTQEGGMFYSLYSRNLDYRQEVHDEVATVLATTLATHFQDYKNVVNTFVVKPSGPKSTFYLHQDTTAVDEFRHSALSLWIPLQDVSPANGGLALMEKSHWLLSPYRGVSFPFAFQSVAEEITKYLKPVEMKAGQVLLFDPRVVHHSFANESGTDRLALVCGLFPKDAAFMHCWRDPAVPNAEIECIEQSERFLLEYPHFFYNCHDRPMVGELVKKVPDDFPPLTSDDLIRFCETNDVRALDATVGFRAASEPCNFIAEPDGINRY